ncbi:MAG: sensor histidine kinase, partial [Acidimicrobiia bacterium]
LFGPFWSGVPNTPFYGGYPVTAVVLVASVRGVPAGMGAAVALSAAVIVRLAVVPGTVTDSLSQVIIYVFSALIIGWAVKVLRQSDRLRREALAQLAEERADRARAEERAEVAAHLHDSVLQTLALIQRSPQAGEEVAILARRQERELRQWLYGRRAGERAGVAQTLRAMCAEVEELYRVKVETVTVGDRQLSPALEALVAAGREAVVNAAKHAGVEEVAVYLEAEAERTSLYVRDRGKGFDLERVPGDRSGIAASIRARIARHGGTVEIRSMPERGTEVRLEVEG